jgi:F0F1-type ATP synthase assembly protein I
VSRRPPGILQFAQLGLMGAACLLGGGGLGWLADSVAGTLPLFLFLGLVGGATLGAVMTWREVKRSM